MAAPGPIPASPQPPHTVSAWLLAGGEGRRMQGQDKGLVSWQGRPLAAWVLDSLTAEAPTQLSAIGITANRHPEGYRDLLAQCDPVRQQGVPLAVPGGVLPDDTDLPERSGPMAGILTALRHSHSEWVLVLPCDTPRLPHDLWPKLLQAAVQAKADIAVPVTQDMAPAAGSDGTRHHWVCALMRRRVLGEMHEAFVNGERKIGRWTQTRPWVGVCFAPETDFQNMNTLETLHGRD
jgi:molybdenum cofactor guanylyltransferase